MFLIPEASLYPNNTFFKLLKSKVVINIVFYIVTKPGVKKKVLAALQKLLQFSSALHLLN